MPPCTNVSQQLTMTSLSLDHITNMTLSMTINQHVTEIMLQVTMASPSVGHRTNIYGFNFICFVTELRKTIAPSNSQQVIIISPLWDHVRCRDLLLMRCFVYKWHPKDLIPKHNFDFIINYL